MHNGKYIVIDGVSPAKSAMVEMLAHQLEAIELPAHIIDGQDTQSDAGARALQQLMSDPAYPLHNRTEALLYNAIRSQLAEVVKKTRGEGKICISTESYLSTLVGQYYGRGDISDYAAANTVVQFASGNVGPDLLLILDTVSNTQKQQTPQEQTLFERLRAGYLWEAQQRKLPVIYATDDLDATFKQVWWYIAQTLSLSPNVPVPTAVVRSAKKQTAVSVPPPPLTISEPAAPAEKSEIVLPVPKPPTPPTVQASIIATEALSSSTTSAGWRQMISSTPFEKKDSQEHYRYYIPEPLKGKLRSQYIRTMNQHFAHYAELFNLLADHLRSIAGTPKAKRDATWEDHLTQEVRRTLTPIVPLAATVNISHATQPEELDQQDSAILNKQSLAVLAERYLPPGYAFAASPVSLIDYYPRNELDTAVDALYAYADLPFRALKETIAGWPYDQKAAVVSSSPMNVARYSFEILSDYNQFRSIHSIHSHDVSHQPINPRYGYATPALIEEAGLSDMFDDCFDRSLELYSALQAEQPQLATYAALMGHQIRWRFNCTLADLKNLRTSQDLVKNLLEKISEVHPLIYETFSGSNVSANASSERTTIS